MKRKGLTLLEVLLSSVILGLTISGLASIFVATKRLTFHVRARVSAAELSKKVIDPLQSEVRQDLWATNCLGSNSCVNVPWTDSSSGTVYTPTCVTSPKSTVRKVVVTLQWQERSSQ